MTLLVLMFHHASAGPHGNTAEILDEHFALIARDCHCVLPGERLDPERLNVCLSFDDGYFDFHAIAFPLLRKHRLRALLAVPVSVIRERSDASRSIRLLTCAQRLPDGGTLGAYCTWSELTEMVASGSISIAAHGFTHCRLDRPSVDLHTEIVVPQTILAARTGRPIESFVLPYGRFNARVLVYARRHYRYVFRIGGADNASWQGPLLYRVDADEMSSPRSPFARHRLATYRVRRYWNVARLR